jgi:sugar/nucleoside kinase (ribokinase family)
MLTPDIFREYDVLYIEGYLVQDHALIETAVKLAQKNNLKVALDLASYNVVDQNREFLIPIVDKYVDILFANEEEGRSLTGSDPEQALQWLADRTEIAVVKTGSKGSMVQHGDSIYRIEAVPTRPVDTTGAGDLYASGFIYGLTRKLPLDICGQIGSLLAGKVIEVIGSKIDAEKWKVNQGEISKIVKRAGH